MFDVPYVRRQLEYGVASALVVGAIWWWTGRRARHGSSLLVRLCLAECGVAAATVSLVVLLLGVFRRDHSNGFAAVALGLYGGCYGVPLCVAVTAMRRTTGSRRHRGSALMAAVLLAATGLWAQLGEPNRLQIRRERVDEAPWSAAAPPLRIVHVSDLQTVGPCERDRRAARSVNELRPDLIVMTGDYVAGPFDDMTVAVRAAREFLGALRATYGIVVVDGHSESARQREWLFAGLDLIHLQDDDVTLDCGHGRLVRVHGARVHAPNLRRLAARREAGVYSVLASHVPDITRDLPPGSVDLHLAGHTHGGQVVIPGFGPPITLSDLPRHQARGRHRYGDHWLNVCAGIGMEGNHAPRIRLFCPPEICLIEIGGSAAPIDRAE